MSKNAAEQFTAYFQERRLSSARFDVKSIIVQTI
jgi:hypothetical protein